MSIILLIFAPLALQYELGNKWLAPVAFVFLLLDVIANYTELALLTWDWPLPGEYTFSKRLARLRRYPGLMGEICENLSRYLNNISPGHVR